MIEPDRTALSPNYYPTRISGRAVVIHSTRSGKSMNPSELEGTINYMLTPGTVSAHWLISRKGEAIRLVGDEHQAWHAGALNGRSWGIELEQGIEADGFTHEQITKLRDIMQGYRDDFGVEWRRIYSVADSGFAGHQDTDQGRSFGKTDPGALFPWQQVLAPFQLPLIAGIGVHYADGYEAEIWNDSNEPSRQLDGVGIRWTDGRIETIWPH